jgi:two-component sensor histidine kinase/PAS domain-containing protein
MIDQSLEWRESEADPRMMGNTVSVDAAIRSYRVPSLALKLIVAVTGAMLLGLPVFGYALIAEHNAAFARYTTANGFVVAIAELKQATASLHHAEGRFNQTGREDEHNDVHHSLHNVNFIVNAILEDNPSRAMREELSRFNTALSHHYNAMMAFHFATDDTEWHRKALAGNSDENDLMNSADAMNSLAKEDASKAETDFNATSNAMGVVLVFADAGLVACGTALFLLYRRRVQRLTDTEKHLAADIGHLRAAFDESTSRLGQVENLFKSSLAVTNITMFIQNRERAISWIHNPKFGNGSSLIGKRDEDFMPPEAYQQTVPFKEDILRSGRGNHLEYSYRDEGRLVHKWLQIDPILEQGAVIGLIGVALDVTERRSREAKIETLAAQLSHRNQNLIAVISAISRQLLNTSATLGDFDRRFTTRLHAIARSFDLIVSRDWQGTPLRELVNTHIRAIDVGLVNRMTVQGHDVLAASDHAEAIGAALHELVQNAISYGALSSASGHVSIDWWIDEDLFGPRTLSFVWHETDGSTRIPRLDHRGYGLNVLEKIVPRRLDGKAFLVAQPGGLKWRLRCPWPDPQSFLIAEENDARVLPLGHEIDPVSS